MSFHNLSSEDVARLLSKGDIVSKDGADKKSEVWISFSLLFENKPAATHVLMLVTSFVIFAKLFLNIIEVKVAQPI